jgi:hypothetical protein
MVTVVMVGGFALGLVVHPNYAGAYPLPAALSDGHDYSGVCPPRPADAVAGADALTVAAVTSAQELADACVRGEQWHAADAGQLAALSTRADVQRVAGDLEAFTAAKPLAVHDYNPPASPTSQTVEFGPTAQHTIESGAGQLDGDLWVIVGGIIGVFMGAQIIRWLWP